MSHNEGNSVQAGNAWVYTESTESGHLARRVLTDLELEFARR